jgi:hypothetical protein
MILTDASGLPDKVWEGISVWGDECLEDKCLQYRSWGPT